MTLGRDTFVSADAQYSRDRVEKRTTYSLRLSGGLSISETMSMIGDMEWDKSRERNGGVIRIGIRKRLGFRGTAQADVQRHHGPLAEADQRQRGRRQREPGQLRVQEMVEDRRGLSHAGDSAGARCNAGDGRRVPGRTPVGGAGG